MAPHVWPYLALEKSRLLAVNNPELEITPSEAQENYRDALNNGLLKIMSKWEFALLLHTEVQSFSK